MSDAQPTPESDSLPTGAPNRPAEYVADISFDDLNLSEPLRRAVAERGYVHPTPVQAQAFRPVMEGKDLIVRSKTGTGKTAAFGLPLLEKISAEDRRVRALILCPTRELALQVAEELSVLGKNKGLKVAAIYGGASLKQQEDALADGSQLVVGTPGRVWDHIGRGNLKLDGCTHVVLDEADEMLDQGFYEEVTRILDQLPQGRQVLLFSATVPPDIQRLIARYTTNAETLLLSGDVLTVEHIRHIRYDVSDDYPKPRHLIYVLEAEQPSNAIIFCNTRDDTSLVTAVLNRNGFDAELLNGDLPQKERERVMAKVKRGEVAFMVATDLAARGIDISGLEYVLNYSLPEDPAVYLHRVGRTGRIGNKGTAINLFSGRELATYSVLEKRYGIKFERKEMPSPEEAMRLWTERHVSEIREASGSSVYEGFLPLAAQLKLRPDSDDLIAFLLKSFFTHLRQEKARAAEEQERKGEGVREERSSRGEERPRREREERPRREREERPRREREERSSRGEERPRREREERPRREREERPRRREREETGRPSMEAGPGEVKLWVNLGTADGLGPGSIVTAMEDSGAPINKVLRAELKPTFAYVFIAEEDVAAFESLTGRQRGEKVLKVERSRPRGERDPNRPPPSPDAGPGEAKLWLNLGMDDGMDDAKFVAALEAAGAPAGKVLRTILRHTYGYAYVPESEAPAFEAIGGKLHGTKPLRVERHKPRGIRADSSRSEQAPAPELPEGQVRLWVGLGRGDGLDEAGLTSALEALGAPSGKLQHIDLKGTYSYIHVAEEDVPAFEALQGKQHGDKALKLERARRR